MLRQPKSTCRPRKAGEDRRGQIPNMVSIHLRPPEATDCSLPGHWEGDLNKGQMNRSAVGVLAERTPGLLLPKMTDSSASSFKLNSMARPVRQTMTYNQGREMTHYAELTQSKGVKVYVCDPHSPWQRAACDNTNGLVRQYLPKRTDLSVHSQEQLDAIADEIYNRLGPGSVPCSALQRSLAQANCSALH